MNPPLPKGGPRPGSGRKPLGEEPTVIVAIRMLPEQREKLQRLGGAPWLRKKIDQAKEPE
ncbi:hypothetical protein [Ramlibacter sp.]|uniref:hypothetical protein n=1 Tax=Ramlibacter sp. TaxID=1917967 RepID=UPI002632A1AF|nr:hypothetical protein [Ramlibacter sp.]MDB5957700.1 hypothetical protein [Ramlibacter sp.]